MIYHIGTAPLSNLYRHSSFTEFVTWISPANRFQFDIETTMHDRDKDKEIVTYNIGYKQDQWVIEDSYLSDIDRKVLYQLLENPRIQKVIHYALFEVSIFRYREVRIRNVWCTHLAEKVLWCGYDASNSNMDYSLDGVLARRYSILMDKTFQTSFNRELQLIPEQVVYAATDVRYLDQIRSDQLLELHQYDLEFTAALEMEAVIGFAEMAVNGMCLDAEAWRKNIALATPIIAEAETECVNLMLNDPVLREAAERLGYIYLEDTPVINMNSPAQALTMLKLVVPWLEGSSSGYIKGVLKSMPDMAQEQRTLLTLWLDKANRNVLLQAFCDQYREDMIALGFFKPKGTININWNSQPQVLALFQAVKPRLKGLSEKDLAEFSHPIGIALSEYKDALKLLTSYGEDFIVEHLMDDGRVRTTFSQIMTTGRISTSKPNMQQIPAKESVGNRYRNCFVPPFPDWRFVSSDYISQELVIIAELTREPVWLEALARGEDLHSIMAELVYKRAWHAGTQDGCEFAAHKQKCSCKVHKRLRSNIKTINFGLAYGMSKFKLSATLRISIKDAELLMIEYFNKVPNIRRTLDYLGNYALRNGFIHTCAPFFRRRWFPDWVHEQREVEPHIQGVRYNKRLGSIERAGKNQPIQGTSADITKTAIVLIMNYLDEHPEIRDKVWLSMQVHDQLDSVAHGEYAPTWAPIQTRLMEDAAKLCFPSGLLKAETQITEKWQK